LFEVLVGTGFRFSGFLFGSGFLVGVVGFVFGWDFGDVIGKMRATVFILLFIKHCPGWAGP
jgi:hypothetical protein